MTRLDHVCAGALAAIFALSGCYQGKDTGGGDGVADGDGGSDSVGDSGGDDGPPVDPFCEDETLPGSITRFVRLTHRQYDNTVRDLLAVEGSPSQPFIGDPAANGFANNAELLTVSDRLARDYRRAAELVADDLIADPARLAAMLPCDASGGDACAEQFIAQFGRRAFRRPLTADEQAGFLSLFQSASGLYANGSDFEQGIALVVEGFLQSPKFLYRVELSDSVAGSNTVKLSGYEVATRLSYLLWNSTPDEQLLAAAEAGELDTAEGVAEHARRLVNDPRSDDPVEDFHEQWLHMEKYSDLLKDPNVYPDFDADVTDAMRAETVRFIEEIIADGGTYADLLTSSESYANAALADIYGLDGQFGDELQPVSLDPETRAGFLTQPGFLAANAYFLETSPIHRGVFIQRSVLCTEIPDPPGDVPTELPPLGGELQTTRDRVEAHTSPAACAGCHELINEPGFAFEGYGAVGELRPMENGVPVDTAGTILLDGAPADFNNAVDLAHQIAASEQARECYLMNWFRYASSRAEVDADMCTLEGLHESLMESDYEVKELLVGLTQTVSFRYRTAEEGE